MDQMARKYTKHVKNSLYGSVLNFKADLTKTILNPSFLPKFYTISFYLGDGKFVNSQ